MEIGNRLDMRLCRASYIWVATVREKKSGKSNFFQVREKSGNFSFNQGNLEKVIKVREKSGNLRSSQKSQLVKKF